MGNNKLPRVYIAGPLFNPGERWYLERIDQMCKDLGCETYLPHHDAGICPPSGDESEFFFQADRQELNKVDLLIAVLNGPDVDPGTAWEMGYAYAHGCPIIGLYDDTRICDPRASINLMVYNSVFEICDSIDKLKERLVLFLSEWRT